MNFELVQDVDMTTNQATLVYFLLTPESQVK